MCITVGPMKSCERARGGEEACAGKSLLRRLQHDSAPVYERIYSSEGNAILRVDCPVLQPARLVFGFRGLGSTRHMSSSRSTDLCVFMNVCVCVCVCVCVVKSRQLSSSLSTPN